MYGMTSNINSHNKMLSNPESNCLSLSLTRHHDSSDLFDTTQGLWDELETYQNLPTCNQMIALNGQRSRSVHAISYEAQRHL